MKQKWIRPQTTIEKFVPDEYIAVCWGVGCDVEWANTYEQNNPKRGTTWWERGCSHDAAHCGSSSKQFIYDSNNDGTPDGMRELGTEIGDLGCTIYTSDSYRTQRPISTINIGDQIFWTTRAADGRVWHHRGTVQGTTPGHPNAS